MTIQPDPTTFPTDGVDPHDRTVGDWHKVHPAEFDAAITEAHGALMGWCSGNGELMPHLTEVGREAFLYAIAAAFNRGVEVGQETSGGLHTALE